MVCSRLGRLDEAMNAFKALLAAQPGDAAAALQLASVQEALGDSQGAMDCLEALQARFPEDSSLLRRLGVLHSRCQQRVKPCAPAWWSLCTIPCLTQTI